MLFFFVSPTLSDKLTKVSLRFSSAILTQIVFLMDFLLGWRYYCFVYDSLVLTRKLSHLSHHNNIHKYGKSTVETLSVNLCYFKFHKSDNLSDVFV